MDRLGFRPAEVYREMRAGRLLFREEGDRILFTTEAVENFEETQRRETEDFGHEVDAWISRIEQELAGKSESFEPVEQSAGIDDRVTYLGDLFIQDAFANGRKGLHIDPLDEGIRILARDRGLLREIGRISEKLADVLTRSLRGQIGEPGEDGIAASRLVDHRIGDRNVQALATRILSATGEHIHIQFQDDEQDLSFAALGYTKKQAECLNELLNGRPGLLLVVGSADPFSEKHSQALAGKLAEGGRLVISLERRQHFRSETLVQLSVPEDPAQFRDVGDKALAMAPDAMMFDEVESEIVCRTIMEAAAAGIAVVAQVRDASGLGAIKRLIELGCAKRFLAEHLLGAVVRRPVRRLCGNCRVVRLATDEERALLSAEPGATVATSAGCESCGDGFSGNRMLFHVLPNSDELYRQILAFDDETEFLRTGSSQQPLALLHCARAAVLNHEIEIGDAIGFLRPQG
jgi:type II secretory ATPase GspE/PulE/Tfp pilus assembly ATPase PilB-like protein